MIGYTFLTISLRNINAFCNTIKVFNTVVIKTLFIEPRKSGDKFLERRRTLNNTLRVIEDWSISYETIYVVHNNNTFANLIH